MARYFDVNVIATDENDLPMTPFVEITVHPSSQTEDGISVISPLLVEAEIDGHINDLINELEEIRKQAKRRIRKEAERQLNKARLK